MPSQNRKLKLYQGILAVALAAAVIFFISDYLGMWFGMWGSLLGELMLLAVAVGTAALFRVRLNSVFPVKSPRPAQVCGTVFLWIGTFAFTMIILTILMYLFPRQMFEVSEEMGDSMMNLPFSVGFLLIVASPAVCEEAVFRGVFFNSLWAPGRNKWIPILITAAVFAVFHGSVIRFFPTFFLGIAMGYLVMETGNILYSVIFHAINNFFSLSASYLAQHAYTAEELQGAGQIVQSAGDLASTALLAVGEYLMICGGSSIFFLYIGRYLIHKGQPGYDRGLFPKEKKRTLAVMLAASFGCMIVGALMMLFSMISIVKQPFLY